MTRRFVEALASATGATSVKAIYPDAGVAAMLAHNWSADERAFAIDSLNARRPVSGDDDLIVICCPDPFTAEECQRTVRQVTEADEKAGVMERPVVLFNQRLSRCVRVCGWVGGWVWARMCMCMGRPRLQRLRARAAARLAGRRHHLQTPHTRTHSGDVGLGLNARRLRENFLKRFNITYSLRPVGELGTVYRRFPGGCSPCCAAASRRCVPEADSHAACRCCAASAIADGPPPMHITPSHAHTNHHTHHAPHTQSCGRCSLRSLGSPAGEEVGR
jgi:hypothetical protein